MAIGGADFSQIYDQHKLGRTSWGASEHLRGSTTEPTKLYTHSAFHVSRSGAAAVEDRQAKWTAGAEHVKRAIDRQYGDGMADLVFTKIQGGRPPGARDINHEVLRGDLALIKTTIDELRNPMKVLSKLPGIGDLDGGGPRGSAAQKAVVDTMVNLIDSRLAAEHAKGREGEPPTETLRAIRKEIEDDPSSNRILKSKALSIVDKAEAQLRMSDELEQAPAFRGFPAKEGWRMLMDGHLQEARGEHGFENEQGYMGGMLKGFTRMLESVRKEEPLSPKLFQTLHDTCTSNVYSKGLITEDVPREGALKQGFRTDDGSNAGVGFPFKLVTAEGDPPRYTGGTTTPEGRAELMERIAAERTPAVVAEAELARAERRAPRPHLTPFFEIMPGERGAPDKLWCNVQRRSLPGARGRHREGL